MAPCTCVSRVEPTEAGRSSVHFAAAVNKPYLRLRANNKASGTIGIVSEDSVCALFFLTSGRAIMTAGAYESAAQPSLPFFFFRLSPSLFLRFAHAPFYATLALTRQLRWLSSDRDAREALFCFVATTTLRHYCPAAHVTPLDICGKATSGGIRSDYFVRC